MGRERAEKEGEDGGADGCGETRRQASKKIIVFFCISKQTSGGGNRTDGFASVLRRAVRGSEGQIRGEKYDGAKGYGITST